MTDNIYAQKVLLDMRLVCAQIEHENALANRETTQFGEWRSDHTTAIQEFRKEYDYLENKFRDSI